MLVNIPYMDPMGYRFRLWRKNLCSCHFSILLSQRAFPTSAGEFPGFWLVACVPTRQFHTGSLLLFNTWMINLSFIEWCQHEAWVRCGTGQVSLLITSRQKLGTVCWIWYIISKVGWVYKLFGGDSVDPDLLVTLSAMYLHWFPRIISRYSHDMLVTSCSFPKNRPCEHDIYIYI